MSDEPALLAAILANPAEDVPRLVYADWLEEHGESERAEFIRVQIQIPQVERERLGHTEAGRTLDNVASSVKLVGLRRRERELWDQYIQGRQEEWFPGWRGWSLAINRNAMGERQSGLATRGFISFAALDWQDWLAQHEAILKTQPIERVKLTTRPPLQELLEVCEPPVPEEGATTYQAVLSHRWPGIEFEMPMYQWRNYTAEYTVVSREDLAQQMRRAIGGLPLIPPT